MIFNNSVLHHFYESGANTSEIFLCDMQRGWIDGQTEAWMNGQMGGRTDGWTDRWADGQMGGRTDDWLRVSWIGGWFSSGWWMFVWLTDGW